MSRRVQQYGWRYDYKLRTVDSSAYIGEFPEWASHLADRLFDRGYMKSVPNQLIVNEYLGTQGISRHVDRSDNFGEEVATVSLLETWEMIFRRYERRIEIPLERRSVAVLSKDARYKWTHEIPSRKHEPSRDGLPRRERNRRISLTFRTVKNVTNEMEKAAFT